MKPSRTAAWSIVLLITFGLGFVVGHRYSHRLETTPGSPDWFAEGRFYFSPGLSDDEINGLVTAICESAIQEHKTRGIAGRAGEIGLVLFMQLSRLPAPAVERNKAVIVAATMAMLSSPYDQNVFNAQIFIMDHLSSDWAKVLARDYVRRFSDIDQSYGQSAHHLGYFLFSAGSVRGGQVVEANGSIHIRPETNEYTEFVKYVVNNSEALGKFMADHNKNELLRFVMAQKGRHEASQPPAPGEAPGSRP